MAKTLPAPTKRELCRLEVPAQVADDLERISIATGAPQAWHRRKALTEYIERFAQS